MPRKAETRSARKPAKTTRKTTAAPATKRRAPAKPRVRKAAKVASAPVQTTEEVRDLIEHLNRRYYDAFQSLNVDEIAKVWWHDDAASCVHPGWDIRHGWLSVRESYREIFSNTRLIRFALGDVRTRVIGDIAYVTCVENLVSEEGDASDYLGAVLATNVFERRRGEWKLIHHHASPFSSDEADIPEGPLH
jgi:ketosteroid isomerase-like protein